MNRITLLFVLFCVATLIACGDDHSPTPSPPSTAPILVQPTNTPVPPPPSPTPRPSPSPQADSTPPPAALGSPMVSIAGGIFTLGSDAGNADSKPPHQLAVGAFALDTFEVTNADFKTFADAAAYKTDAEKTALPTIG